MINVSLVFPLHDEQDDIAVAVRIALSRYHAGLHNVHESTVLIFFRDLRQPGRGAEGEPPHGAPHAGITVPGRILLISRIGEIRGGFANTLVVETGAGEGSRVRPVE